MRKFQISKFPNFHIFLWLHVKNVGLDSLVGGDGESCDVVLPCREGLDRALPADLRMILSEDTIGGKIVDRDRDYEPAVVIVRLRAKRFGETSPQPWRRRVGHPYYLARIILFTLQDVVCQERFP